METGTATIDFEHLKKRVIRGGVALLFGQVLFLGLSLLVNDLALPTILSPSVIGTFNLATTVIAFFNFFSDIGLAASIIQKKEITQHDLTTTFVIQEVLVGTLAVLIFIFAPFIASFYHLDIGGSGLIRALSISFFIISFKSIPSVLLERELKFKELVVVQAIESVLRNSVLLVLAILGFGLYSYAFAEVLAAVIGAVVLYNISPWKIAFQYSKESARTLLRFGVPYQLNQILALFKDQAVDLFVAHMITAAQLGFVSLAQSWAFVPLQVMNITIRVTFPAFAKLQDDRLMLARAVERALYLMSLVLYPAIFGLLCLVSNFVAIIGPQKWASVVPMVYFFSFSTFWASISTTYTNVFNAVGEAKLTLKLMVMWSILEWTLTPLLVWHLGYIGVAIATAIIGFSSIATVILMRQIAPVHLLASITKPIVASLIMAAVLYPTAKIFLQTKLAVLPLIAFGGIVYAGVIFLIDRKRLLIQIKEILYAVH